MVRPKFGLAKDAPLIHLGRRAAFPQSAAAPLQGRVLAIGDAAFSHDPIGGRGLSFALGSAFAAVAVLQTWRDHPARWECARAYYAEYVAAEKRRHLAFLPSDKGAVPRPDLMPSRVIWSAKIVQAPLALGYGIDVAEVALMQTGNAVRWLGRFDVLELREICANVQPADGLLHVLCRRGFIPSEARALINWALRNGLLRPVDPHI